MYAYHYFMANFKRLKQRRRLLYEDLSQENCFLIAADYVVRAERFSYVDSEHKPDWILSGQQPPSPLE